MVGAPGEFSIHSGIIGKSRGRSGDPVRGRLRLAAKRGVKLPTVRPALYNGQRRQNLSPGRAMDDSNDSLKPKYRRVVLKLSGESFGHSGGKSGISIDETLNIANQLKRVHARGVELGIVIGAGNILRGSQFSDRKSVV